MRVGAEAEVLIMVYHQVITEKTSFLGKGYGITKEALIHQITRLRSWGEFIGYDDFLDAIAGKIQLPERSVLMTFDDGTVDHYEVVYPILAMNHIKGVFFVTTEAVENRRPLPAHLRHYLTSKMGEKEFYRAFSERFDLASNASLEAFLDIPEVVIRRHYGQADLAWSRFKYAINFHLPAAKRNEVLRALFQEHAGDPEQWGASLYVSWKDLKEMKAEGMTIGGHSHEHEALSFLEESALQEQITRCRQLLVQHLRLTRLAFAYPYGRQEHYNDVVMARLANAGFSCAFANVSGMTNLPLTAPAHLFALPRVDTSELETFLGKAG